MDGWMADVSLRRFCGKSDVWTDGWIVKVRYRKDGWMDGWMDKCKFEIVFVVSQMYGLMD